MRPLRRPSHATIHYHGHAKQFLGTEELTFSVNGVRWVYSLTPLETDNCLHIIKVASAAKGFAYAKKHAKHACRLDDPTDNAAQSTLLRHRGAQASRSKRLKVTLPNV